MQSSGVVSPWGDRAEIREKVVALTRAELKPRHVEFVDMTPCADIDVDSIDVIHILFRVEEEYGITIGVLSQESFTTMGEFFDLIVDRILETKR